MTDTVSLRVDAGEISGWTSVRIVQSIETCPTVFEIGMTAGAPAPSFSYVLTEGQPCTVWAGDDLLVTGYIDRIVNTLTSKAHELRIIGRGKCADLVDCSSELPSGQVSNQTVLQIAQALAKPYGIKVTARAAAGPPVPQFNVSVTDSPWAIIEEVCRYRALLAYEGTDGNLILDQVGSQKAASGFAEGQNVQSATYTRAMDGRFSEVDAFLQAMTLLGDLGKAGNLLDRETDPNVPRHRRLSIIAEAPYGGQDVAKLRAIWEVARRAGRGRTAELVIDSWRDAAGALWAPNTLATVALPSMGLPAVEWCLGSVAFVLDGANGSRAEIVAMDPAAFRPEPILLAPVLRGLTPKQS